MKKTLLIFIILALAQLGAKEAIGSLGEFRTFIEKGQAEGYFPKTVPIDDPLGRTFKLETVDLLFRKLIRWNINSHCPRAYDQIILATGSEGRYIVCDTGRTAVLLGSGNDNVEDATGNDIYYPGGGDDILSLGSGSDIVILGPHWGDDRVRLRTSDVDASKIFGYDGSFPYRYGDFVIFTKEIAREDIVWRGNALCHRKTGDCLHLPNRKVNVLFASHPKETDYAVSEEKVVPLTQLRAEAMLKQGKLLYVAKGDEGLMILDVSEPVTPVVLSKTVLPGRALSVRVEKGIGYVAQGDYMLEGKRGWVSVIDVRDAKHPKVLEHLIFGNIVRSVAVKNGVLYVPVNHKGRAKGELYLYAVSLDKNPKLLKKVPLSLRYVNDIALFGKQLYLLKRRSSVEVFDVGNPKLPRPIMHDPLYGKKGYEVHVQNGMLAFIDEKHSIQLYRAAATGALQKRCTLAAAKKGEMFDSAAGENKIYITPNLLYRAQGRAGIAVFDLKSCKERKGLAASAYEPSVSNIIKVGACLLSFHPRKDAVCYTFETGQKTAKRPVKDIKPISRGKMQQLLYKAALYNNAAEAKRLLELGANPNFLGHEKTTPMQIAARVGSLDALKVMLDAGGKADRKSMMLAALTEQVEAMKLLERYGGNIRARSKGGCTTLHYIAADGPLEMVKYLIEKGVPYNATCRKNEAPIHWANFHSNCPVIRYLEGLYPKGSMKIDNKACEGKEQSDKMRSYLAVKALAKKGRSQTMAHMRSAWPKRSAAAKAPRHPVKIKAKQKGDMLNVKFMIKHPMHSPVQAAKRGLPSRCIEHIALRIGSRLVADISTGCNVSKNPLFKLYNIENGDTDALVRLIASDSTGMLYRRSVRIKQSRVPTTVEKRDYAEEKAVNYHRSHQGFFDAKSVDAALEALYGKVYYEEGGIEVTVPKIAANPGAIPVAFKSPLELESVAMLLEGSTHPGVAVFRLPKGVKANAALKVKIEAYAGQKVTLTVVAKSRDGRYHMRKVPFVVAYGEAT